MNQENGDREIKQLFQNLRQEDVKHAPAFARVWQAAMSQQQKRRRAMPGLRLAAACVVLVIFFGSVLLLYQNRQRIFRNTGLLTSWRSPTASLLRLPPASPATRSALGPAPDVPRKNTLSGWQSPTTTLRKSLQTRSFHRIRRQSRYPMR